MTNENKINKVLSELSNLPSKLELEENININYESLNFNIKNENETNKKINLIKTSLSKMNDYHNNINNQKEILDSNNKFSKKVTKDLKRKNNVLSIKKNKFLIEYDKIEELEKNIKKNKKIINKYINILKYLVPILILVIIIFVILQSNEIF